MDLIIKVTDIQGFFNRPGINKAGFCKEVSITPQYLNRVLKGKQPLTKSFVKKILPLMENYGFDITDYLHQN